MDRSYEGAICCLNGRKARARSNLDDMRGSDDMVEWLKLLGHSIEDLNALNVIHIAGTKGKGSTCTFAASFLKAYGNASGYPQKVGLYTSPHMKNIRERICINGEPISKELFTTCFFEIWDKLPDHATHTLDIPRYLQLLALLSFRVFIKEKIDVAIYETHLGGEFDATNVIRAPIVTAVTSIAMDHVRLLGPTIKDIAWHKAGIFKSGSVAFSTLQESAVTTVLQQRAAEKGVMLKLVGVDSTLPTDATALKPNVQRINCSLALAAVRAWLSVKAPEAHSYTKDFVACGVKQFFCPGRYHQINDRNHEWFLDGAHNKVSLQHTVQWFAETVSEDQKSTRILIFSHFSERDGAALLECVSKSLQENNLQMQHVILSTYDERQDGRTRIDRNLKNRFSPEIQELYAVLWKNMDHRATISRTRTIEEALHRAREIGDQNDGMQTLVTGSLHLVSGALYLLDPAQPEQDLC